MKKQEKMTKEKLLKILRKLLRTDDGLEFLVDLKEKDLERLASVVRERIESA